MLFALSPTFVFEVTERAITGGVAMLAILGLRRAWRAVWRYVKAWRNRGLVS